MCLRTKTDYLQTNKNSTSFQFLWKVSFSIFLLSRCQLKMYICLQIFRKKKTKNSKLLFMRKSNRKTFSNCNEYKTHIYFFLTLSLAREFNCDDYEMNKNTELKNIEYTSIKWLEEKLEAITYMKLDLKVIFWITIYTCILLTNIFLLR